MCPGVCNTLTVVSPSEKVSPSANKWSNWLPLVGNCSPKLKSAALTRKKGGRIKTVGAVVASRIDLGPAVEVLVEMRSWQVRAIKKPARLL